MIMEKLEQTKKRFVVFLDIMGFKERVARNTQESLYEELTDFNKDITTIINSTKKIKTTHSSKQNDSSDITLIKSKEEDDEILIAQFSDSIVIFTNGNTRENLLTISDVAKQIMISAIKRERPIPLKGALAEGYITCDMVKQLFFGQALIDAYLLEENIQYYGIVVHHSAEKSVKDYAVDLFEDHLIPLKSGKIKHYELVWYNDSYDDVKFGLERIRLSVSDSPRKYVDNTNHIIDDFIESKASFISE